MRTLFVACALFITMGPSWAQVDPIGKVGAALIEKNAASICTVNIVFEIKFAGQTREHRLIGDGTIVHKTGMLLMSLQTVQPNVNVKGSGGRSISAEIVPVEFKVIIGNEEEEREAFLVGKDSKLGLAFIQLKDGLPDKYQAAVIDFRRAKSPKVGEQTISLDRLSKGYDYAPFFTVSRVIGKMRKPRKAWIVGGSYSSGLPVFNSSGELVGCFSRVASGLGAARPGSGQLVILRGGTVGAAVGEAVKKAKELQEKEKVEREDK